MLTSHRRKTERDMAKREAQLMKLYIHGEFCSSGFRERTSEVWSRPERRAMLESRKATENPWTSLTTVFRAKLLFWT